ncbi:SNF2-related protein [Variovorax sp. MHTC-1]|uniref:SNF2-related protein n=1 Tax=Variovorax sp. MHTC-1 TaxID=2495593 RepID=UPI000F88A34B|nr:SNF2-related protein [Variovorax sp. MHTC-1]RST52631.1 hypothetical protein EJI01_15590 [Variovorax sp. MHTC-1]
MDDITSLPSSGIELVSHQVSVVRRVLSDPVKRYLLADEVGMGRTIEAGFVIRQCLLDEPHARVVVLAPATLVEQWEGEPEELLRESGVGRCSLPRHAQRIRIAP